MKGDKIVWAKRTLSWEEAKRLSLQIWEWESRREHLPSTNEGVAYYGEIPELPEVAIFYKRFPGEHNYGCPVCSFVKHRCDQCPIFKLDPPTVEDKSRICCNTFRLWVDTEDPKVAHECCLKMCELIKKAVARDTTVTLEFPAGNWELTEE